MDIPATYKFHDDPKWSRHAALIFTIAALLLPAWFLFLGVLTPHGARGLGDLKGLWVGWLSFLIVLLSFLGSVCTPFLIRQSLERKITYACLAIIGFYFDVTVSMIMVTAVFGFVD